MCPNKVSKILNVSTPLALFVFFDRKWLTCATHAFFGTKISKLPHICMLIPQSVWKWFRPPPFPPWGWPNHSYGHRGVKPPPFCSDLSTPFACCVTTWIFFFHVFKLSFFLNALPKDSFCNLV